MGDTNVKYIYLPKFARYSGVSALIWGTVPGSTQGDSCESAVKKNQRASDARRLGFTGGVGFTIRYVPGYREDVCVNSIVPVGTKVRTQIFPGTILVHPYVDSTRWSPPSGIEFWPKTFGQAWSVLYVMITERKNREVRLKGCGTRITWRVKESNPVAVFALKHV